MKNKDTQLLEEAYTRISEAESTNSKELINQLKNILDQLVPLVKAGDPSIDVGREDSELNMVISNGMKALNKARRLYFASQRSPESKKAAAEKAKATIAKDKAESEKWSAIRKKEIEDDERRLDSGYLPPQLYDVKGTPNPKYYELDTIEDDGYSSYILKDKYVDKKVSNKRVPDDVLWVKRIPHSQETIDRINAKKQASADRAWMSFAYDNYKN